MICKGENINETKHQIIIQAALQIESSGKVLAIDFDENAIELILTSNSSADYETLKGSDDVLVHGVGGKLIKQGFKNINILSGGIQGWVQSGLPLIKQ